MIANAFRRFMIGNNPIPILYFLWHASHGELADPFARPIRRFSHLSMASKTPPSTPTLQPYLLQK
jgi:hypothetical protein